jgi:hypothetical protein
VERAPQRGHRSARRCALFLAESALGLLCCVYRACVRCVRSPPQTTPRSLEEAKPERDGLRPQGASLSSGSLVLWIASWKRVSLAEGSAVKSGALSICASPVRGPSCPGEWTLARRLQARPLLCIRGRLSRSSCVDYALNLTPAISYVLGVQGGLEDANTRP